MGGNYIPTLISRSQQKWRRNAFVKSQCSFSALNHCCYVQNSCLLACTLRKHALRNIGRKHHDNWASLVAQLVKNLPAMWETWVRSLGWEDPLKKGKLSTTVFWPGEFHGLYSPWGLKESDTTERVSLLVSPWYYLRQRNTNTVKNKTTVRPEINWKSHAELAAGCILIWAKLYQAGVEDARLGEAEPNSSGLSLQGGVCSFIEKPGALEAVGLQATQSSGAQWRGVWAGDKKGRWARRWTPPREGQRQGTQSTGRWTLGCLA